MSAFPTTRWTLVDALQGGDDAALEGLLEGYRPALVAYLRPRAPSGEAEDLAQEVLLRLVRGGILRRADRARGRLRSLLRGVSRNVLGEHLAHRRALKRGGDRARLSELPDVAQDDRDEDDFDRKWWGNLLRAALARLAQEHPDHFEAFRRAAVEETPQAAVAEALGCSEGAVKKRVHRGRRELIGYLQEAVARYASSAGEYEEELRCLARLLDGGHRGGP